jgi:hypothetical protein
MLKLSKNDGTPIDNFENYTEFLKYIMDQENVKLLKGHPEFGQTKWSFLYFPWERVLELYHVLKKEYNLETLSKALQEGSGIIEVCRGDERDLRLIIASPDVDIEGHGKDFCDDYCHAHNLIITECDH